MNEKSKVILEEAGWHQGRKIDLTEILEVYNKANIEVFPKAKEFLEEFGDIIIKKNGYPYHIFDVKYLFGDGYIERLSTELRILFNEKVLTLGDCAGYIYSVYITESGRIYDDFGYLGDNKYDIWDLIFQTVDENEFHERMKTWKELGLEERLTEIEIKLLNDEL